MRMENTHAFARMAAKVRRDRLRIELHKGGTSDHVLQVANQYLRTWKVSDLARICRDTMIVHQFSSRREVLARIEHLVRQRETSASDYGTHVLVEDMLTFLSHVLVRLAQIQPASSRA